MSTTAPKGAEASESTHPQKSQGSLPQFVHPGLIPGIGVEQTDTTFRTSKSVFTVAIAVAAAVVIWAFIAPESLSSTGTFLQGFIVTNFGWLFSSVAIVIVAFMAVLGIGPTGNIKLGHDEEEPEFTRFSWISMLFAAGLGIGLLFYGPLEPLSHFLAPPPWSLAEVEGGTPSAVFPAMAQALFHYTFIPWAVYALVGGAIAYSAYRRGRLPLISAVFEPVFPDAPHRMLGKVIDIAAVLVTLFGTATSLGIGAMQIQAGTEIVTGLSFEGNAFLICAISVFTAFFTLSAVTGVKKGVRILSNTNSVLVIGLAIFVLIFGPTLFILNLIPSGFISMLQDFFSMQAINTSQGVQEQEFLNAWTIFYWAWWMSWSPFVGMFIAKISRGRSLREYVTVVVLVPSIISTIWFAIFGGTTIWQALNGKEHMPNGTSEEVLFEMFRELPLFPVLSVIIMLSIMVFFVTAADSATVVMSSMSQQGEPEPASWIRIVWGVTLGAVTLALLLVGGESAISGLQTITVTTSIAFVVVLIGFMIAWWKDLTNDPYMIRRHFARAAISKGVERGIEEHGDDFVFGATEVAAGDGAGAEFDTDNPVYSEWYTTHTSEIPVVVVTAGEDPTLDSNAVEEVSEAIHDALPTEVTDPSEGEVIEPASQEDSGRA